jgi:hypothetical protein
VIPKPGGDLGKVDSTAGLFVETIQGSVALERAALVLAVRTWLQLWLQILLMSRAPCRSRRSW